MTKSTLFTLLVFVSTFSVAQEGWNWPKDPNMKTQAMERQAYYKLLIAQSKHSEAMKPLNWLYENNPDLNQSIYIEGVECLENIIEKTSDKQRKERLQDSLLWMFDQRIEYFDNAASTMDRKAYEAFKMHYRTPSKYPMLYEIYSKAYEMNGPEISTFNLNPYMLLAKQYHQAFPDKMPAETVLDIHTQISDIIEIKRKNGENADKLDKEQAKTDAWLSSIPGILSCQFIKEKLVPKFRANPTDLNTAKKIFKYSLEAKCTDQPYFLEASEPVFKVQPSFVLASNIGNKYLVNGEVNKGLKYHAEALKLASNNDERYSAYMGQAVANSKLGNKAKARALAYEALSAKPGSPEAYNLIGNLYFTSFDDCKAEKSQVQDRAIFIAAYEMYKKAGNSAQMTASKAQFPSIEDIFNESKEEGNQVTIGCWVNTTVSLQRR
ncbi:tetratricopeptide repeat protein [Ekhidna sp.]|uniref:tetratricopeptide repeat protein n=1 Tax=Ekhidna sp. TaxID=2608089 RepID=UPI003298BB9C